MNRILFIPHSGLRVRVSGCCWLVCSGAERSPPIKVWPEQAPRRCRPIDSHPRSVRAAFTWLQRGIYTRGSLKRQTEDVPQGVQQESLVGGRGRHGRRHPRGRGGHARARGSRSRETVVVDAGLMARAGRQGRDTAVCKRWSAKQVEHDGKAVLEGGAVLTSGEQWPGRRVQGCKQGTQEGREGNRAPAKGGAARDSLFGRLTRLVVCPAGPR